MEKLPQDIDDYISSFPQNIQYLLQEIRATIRNHAPDAQEAISYGMPTFRQSGNLVHFAAHKQHIGFYPGSSGILAFKDRISMYKNAKGSVQFPFNQPLPLDLVAEMVEFRVQENSFKEAAKKKSKQTFRKF